MTQKSTSQVMAPRMFHGTFLRRKCLRSTKILQQKSNKKSRRRLGQTHRRREVYEGNIDLGSRCWHTCVRWKSVITASYHSHQGGWGRNYGVAQLGSRASQLHIDDCKRTCIIALYIYGGNNRIISYPKKEITAVYLSLTA